MSSIVTDRGLVHYEAHGHGRAVILLHGWLESWDHWLGTMKSLGRSCKAYALDFWGFGESGKQGGGFAVRDYIEMVEQFMERLGIEQAPVIGHSMASSEGCSGGFSGCGRWTGPLFAVCSTALAG